jgi:cyclophilin family peptidyl-prolyl cis-trans isomerase
VIKGFMIQGGDPTGTGMGGPGYKFRDELDGDGAYTRGTVAMANSGPNTNGSQFFIMHKDVGLPHSYTIFGKVTDGIDVVDSIADSKTDRSDRPESDVRISAVEVAEA